MSGRRRAAPAALACVLVLTVACRGGQRSGDAAPAEPAASVQPVSLPDISNASAIVQTQLREQHAKMTSVVAEASRPAAERANAYGEMGKLFVAADHYQAAERCFLNARVLAPADMRWPYYLAHVARLSNETTRAASFFEQALTLQPDHVPSLVWLAEMHLANGQASRARPLLLKARSIDAGEAAASYALGRVALEERDYSGAAKELEAGLAAVPSATRLHYALAMAYRGLGDTAQAEAHLKLRGETDLPPADALMGEVGGLLKNATIFETRGTQAIDARQWPEAVRELRQALAVTPNNGFTRLNLGTALYMTGDVRAALEQYQAAVRLRPGLAKAHFAIGVIRESDGRDDDAIAAFETAVRQDPGYVEARFSLANALRRRGRVRESLPHYDEVLRLSPAVSQASFGYAIGLVRLGEYAQARARLERDVQAFPDQPGIAHALARLLAAAPDDSVRDGARALVLVGALEQSQSPTLALVETMAMALAEVGRFDEAVRRQRQAIEGARRAGRPDLAARLTANLRLYEQRRPCRTPWADDDPVHRPANQ